MKKVLYSTYTSLEFVVFALLIQALIGFTYFGVFLIGLKIITTLLLYKVIFYK